LGNLASKAVFLFLVAAISFSCISLLPKGEGLDGISFPKSFSAVAPPMINLNVVLGIIAVASALVGASLILIYRKYIKIVVAVVLIVIVAVSAIGVIWYSEASINFWFVSPYTTVPGDNALTLNCENSGHLPGTFDLVLSFANARFSSKTSPPFQSIDNQTVKFTFTLQPGEKLNRQVWFNIDSTISDFYAYLSFQQNDDNFLVKSVSNGVNSVSYQKDVVDENFTMRTFYPPP
jgi:hypothetical protein